MSASTVNAVAQQRRVQKPGQRRTYLFLHSGWILFIVLIALAVVYIYPFLIAIATSFKTQADSTANPVSLIPSTWTLAAYRSLFASNGDANFPLWLWNTFLFTVIIAAANVFLDSLAGYALSRLHFSGRGIIAAGLIVVMSVPSTCLLIPKFLVLNYLGIYDTYPGVILPLIIDAAAVFLMKNFFDSIPVSIEEQAKIDGAGTFRIFWSIILPMARPALITITILQFQGAWNQLQAYVVSTSGASSHLATLTIGVASLTSGALGSAANNPLKLAAAVTMTVPVVILFFIFQRHIMNTTEGGVKD